MQANQSDMNVSLDEVVTHSGLAARRIADGLEWGEGAIQPLPEQAGHEKELVAAALDAIESLAAGEEAYSSCTDGRLPVQLQNGEPVPVREQAVGADMVSAFFVAEVLGPRFYADVNAPVAERVNEVAAFLKENGLLPSSHIACGAAAGFVTIIQNILRFSKKPQYIARLQTLLPGGAYDAELHESMLMDMQKLLDTGVYNGLTPETFLHAAEEVGGARAIAELRDDGRGVRGHMEEAIMRLQVPGRALNTAKLAANTNGREVFGVNDTRMERLARMFARGNDQDYKIARIALEDFASSGHGTLAKGLPTYVITVA
jgi:hypothetical protein